MGKRRRAARIIGFVTTQAHILFLLDLLGILASRYGSIASAVTGRNLVG
jgi:hypothetical protein